MTEEKLNELVIHDIPSKALFDELVKRGVIGEHDISFVEEDTVESLGITGASVGQVPVVNSVDENGAPNGWGAGDLPSGGSGDDWELINEITTDEWVSSVTVNRDSNGNAFSLKKMKIFMTLPVTTNEAGEVQTSGSYALYSINGENLNYQNPSEGWQSGLFVWTIEAWGDYCTVTCFKGVGGSYTLHHSGVYEISGAFSTITQFTWRVFAPTYGWSSTKFKVYGVKA